MELWPCMSCARVTTKCSSAQHNTYKKFHTAASPLPVQLRSTVVSAHLLQGLYVGTERPKVMAVLGAYTMRGALHAPDAWMPLTYSVPFRILHDTFTKLISPSSLAYLLTEPPYIPSTRNEGEMTFKGVGRLCGRTLSNVDPKYWETQPAQRITGFLASPLLNRKWPLPR